jgi:pyruvate,orthophosphate dikinase
MAGQIAPLVDFFSFGTNDLTQTTMGLSRDDAAKFLPTYVEKRILMDDPFESIDEAGVGELIALAVQRGRKVNPHLELGICGEHGGDPKSINFFSRLRFDSVSCSPYRVPIARLALGQEQISIASKATKKNQSKQKSLKARGE